MKASHYKLIFVLGLVSAVGALAVDMYLPALPSIGQSLGADPAAVQLTLTAYFLSLGVGQLLYGPASDVFGRKAPIYFGLVLFAVASVGCALTTDVHHLIVLRFIQGLGACAGMVIPTAIVRDLETGPEAARMMSTLMLVFSVSPILAPLFGSFIIHGFGWRAVFWCVCVASIVSIGLIMFALKESRPPYARVQSSFASAMKSYGVLLKNRNFVGLSLIGAFGTASFFIYLSNSSFVIIEHYHYSPKAYGLFFGVNAFAFIGAAQLNGWLSRRFGLRPLILVAVIGYCAAMLAVLALFALGVDRASVLAVGLFIGFAFLGMVVPTAAVLAMNDHGSIAGAAAALIGTLQFAIGSVVIWVVGQFVDGTPLPMVIGIAGTSVVSLVIAYATLLRAQDPEQEALTPLH